MVGSCEDNHGSGCILGYNRNETGLQGYWGYHSLSVRPAPAGRFLVELIGAGSERVFGAKNTNFRRTNELSENLFTRNWDI